MTLERTPSAAIADDLGRTPPAMRHRDARSAPACRSARPLQGWDRADRNELALRFMPLARRIASRYHTPRDREDVEQVAYLALLKAIDRFDPARGNSFVTFATPTIAGAIKNHLRDHTWDIHVPRRLQDSALRAARVRGELTAELGRTPRVQEIAARLDSDPESVSEALRAVDARDATSLDQGIDPGDSGGPPLGAAHGSEDPGFDRTIDRAALRAALGYLTDQERQVLGLRFLCELPQSEIGARLGVSQMQVSRLLRSAIERIRRPEAGQRGCAPSPRKTRRSSCEPVGFGRQRPEVPAESASEAHRI